MRRAEAMESAQSMESGQAMGAGADDAAGQWIGTGHGIGMGPAHATHARLQHLVTLRRRSPRPAPAPQIMDDPLRWSGGGLAHDDGDGDAELDESLEARTSPSQTRAHSSSTGVEA